MYEVKKRMDELQDSTMKHAKIVNDTMQREITRMEKVSSAMEKHTMGDVAELKQSVSSLEQNMEKWKLNLEDAEGKKLLEVHSAMKVLNANFQRVSKDNKDRFEILQREFQAMDTAMRNQISDVAHKVDGDLKSVEERTLMVIEKYFMKVQAGTSEHKIQGVNLPMNSMELDQRITALKDEQRQYIERIIVHTTDKIMAQKQ